EDEITLLATACMMVDAAYEELYRVMRPGMRENECVGLVSKVLYDLGSEHVEGVNAISGERCNPHPHVYTDRVLRPGDPAYFDILHSFMGYPTCYYRTFVVGSASPAQVDAYTRCREYLDTAIGLIKPGVSTADVVKVWPKAAEFGFPNEEAAFALQYGHGVGLAMSEKPIFSRLVSIDYAELMQRAVACGLELVRPGRGVWSRKRGERRNERQRDARRHEVRVCRRMLSCRRWGWPRRRANCCVGLWPKASRSRRASRSWRSRRTKLPSRSSRPPLASWLGYAHARVRKCRSETWWRLSWPRMSHRRPLPQKRHGQPRHC